MKSSPDFIRENTALESPPLVPEIELHLANEGYPLWQKTSDQLEEMGLPPPFWAFAWAGGQALARYIFDNPELVADRKVLDFGSGSGIVAIAAAKAGASHVTASDIDAYAIAAMEVNAAANEVEFEITDDDLTGTECLWDTVLAADVCYEQPMSGTVTDWLRALAKHGADVLIGDPRRMYLPKDGLEQLAKYSVKTKTHLEDTDLLNAQVWRVVAD
ncbi:MAG: nicotinamide N-methylase [Rhodospirillaceae bacterium]|nr:nicotinamide N-methylase [Rhodospirillaceae bacterium]HAA93888.1 nicotinamide N-methylase [Rhodospirillaceae bacterium]